MELEDALQKGKASNKQVKSLPKNNDKKFEQIRGTK